MNIKFLLILSNILFLLYPRAGFTQAPILGSTRNFSLFTAVGAFSNDGATNVVGDIGTNVGAFTGFPPGVVVGQIHVQDGTSAQAATDVAIAYNSFPAGGSVIGVTLGNAQILAPGVYTIGAASTLNGTLTFNGSATDLFIIKIDGALSTNTNSNIVITGGASACNVFWQINGAFTLGTNSSFQGTVLASGAITLNIGSSLFGRALTTAGAVELHTTTVSVPPPPIATISASGSIIFCLGDNVTLTASLANSYLWSNGAITQSITVSAAGSYSVIVTDFCGTDTSISTVVTVNPLPTATISANGPLTFCQGGSVILTASGGSTYLWSTGATTSSITVSASGSYTVVATSEFGCKDTSAAVLVTVNPLPTATISANGPLTFCQGGSVILTASGGSTYLWSNGATTSSITVTTSGSYTVIATNMNGCTGASAATSVVVNPNPVATISANGPVTFCQGGSVILTASLGSSYLWSTGATTQSITVTTSGSYSVTVTNANICQNTSAATTVTVNPSAIPTISANGPLIFCAGGSVILTSSAASGYLWSTGATTQSITVTTAGSYSVTTMGTCAGTSAATIVTINPSAIPTISASGPLTFCPGGSVILTSSGASAYLWSTGATTQSITVTAAGSYTVTTTGTCAGTSAATVVTISASAVPTITANGPLTFCQGGSVILTSSSATGYLWSTGATTQSITVTASGNYSVTTSGTCAATSVETIVSVIPLLIPTITPNGPITFCQGGSVILTSSPSSGYLWSTGATTQSITVIASGTYSVTTTANCGGTSAEVIITVNPSAIPTIIANGPLTFCPGGSVILTSSGASGYLWSTGATTQSITVTTAGTYTVTTTGTCAGTSAPTIVTINPSAIPTISANGPLTFCPGGSVILTSSGASGYLWSTGATTQSITVTEAGSYTVTTTGTCAGTSAATTVIISSSAIPTITANGPLTFCQGGSVILTASSSSGYLWSTGATTQSITVSASGNYSVTTSGTCAATSASTLVTVIPILIPTITANGPLIFCQGGSVTLTASSSSGYLWSTGATTQSITVSASGSYSVTTTAICGGTSIATQVTVNPSDIPIISASGPLTFCLGGSVILTSSASSGYLWSTGATTQSITVSTAGTYSVTTSGLCGGTSAPTIVTINPSAIPTISASGPLTFCPGGSVILTSSGASGYLWSTGATTQSITVTAAGSYSVTTTGTCAGVSATTIVSINPSAIPTIIASGPLTFCQGGSVVLTSSSSNGYLWSTGATTQSITVTAPGNYSVTTSGTCAGTSAVIAVVVIPITIPIITANGPLTFCQGGSVVLTSSSSSGYLWSTGATTQSITVTSAGSYSVTTTANCGGTSATVSIIVNPLVIPTISANGPLIFCPGGSVILTSSPANGYLWSTGATTQSITVTAAGNYSVTTIGTCASTSAQVTVSITPSAIPIITASGPLTFCPGGSVILTSSGASGYLWSTGATTQSITVTTAGSYSVTTTGVCAGTSATTIVTINPSAIPTITVNGPLIFCEGGSVILTSSGAIGYLWSTGATTQSITVIAAGNYTVTTSGTCAGTSTSINVNVNPILIPTITANGPLGFCQGDSVTLTASSSSGYLWSTGATTQSIKVKAPGIYTVAATGNCGGTSVPAIITINPPTIPIISASGPLVFCPGDSVILTASTASGYLWNTGATTQQIIVKTAGNYSVTTSGICGAASTATIVIINPITIPIITVNGSPTLCEGDSIILTSSPGIKYLWSTGDTTQRITVKQAGNYTVSTSGFCGSISASTGIIVNILTIPIITVNGPLSFCPGDSVILTSSLASKYAWSNGDTTQSIIVKKAGSYTVTTPGLCAGKSDSIIVSLNSTTTPLITASGSLTFCIGDSVILTSSLDSSYLWSTGDTTRSIIVKTSGIYSVYIPGSCSDTSLTVIVSVSSSLLPTISVNGPTTFCIGGRVLLTSSVGSYYRWNNGAKTQSILVNTSGTFWVRIYNECGYNFSAPVKVTVNDLPECNIIATSPLCKVESTQLCATIDQGKYLWNTGDTTQCITISQAGTYSVVITNEEGCSTSCSKTITASQFPDCTISGDTAICEGDSEVLSVPGGDVTYQWNTGAITQSITSGGPGIYTVTVTNSNGCVSTCSKTVSIKSTPACVIMGHFDRCEGDVSELKGPMGAASYLWNTGSTDMWIGVEKSGTYSLTVTNTNGCVTQCSQYVSFQDCGLIVCLPGYGKVVPNFNEIIRQKTEPSTLLKGYNNLENEIGYFDAQAFPNPFEHSTLIEFSSSSANKVKVEVYNLKGQKVASLFEGAVSKNERRQVRFHAAGLSDGIYYYTITDGKSSISKKLVLLKN